MADQLGLDLDGAAPAQPRTAALDSYHVRSHQTADEALAGDAKAGCQEDAVMAWFRARGRDHRAGPSEVWMALGGMEKGWPLTSIRRAMTNLATARPGKEAQLVHYAAERRPGPFGAMESTWGLK
jgi:hypothetical protein